MCTAFSAISSRNKFKVDFALVPVATILVEFSIFITQLSSDLYKSLGDLILLRLTHTILMLLISLSVAQIFISLKSPEANYRTMAMSGIFVFVLGDLSHAYLANAFDIGLINNNRRIGVVLLEGAVWFPAFLIIAGNRKEIFIRFKEYEKRLIIATRARSRTSVQFRDVQVEIQGRIRQDLYALSASLIDSISKSLRSGESLVMQNQVIAPLLLGDDLRKLSVTLDSRVSTASRQGLVGKKIDSLLILFQQFRILYISTIRRSPLPRGTYAAILLGLVTPLYLYFYTFTETVVAFLFLFISIFFIATLIKRLQVSGTPNALKGASFLILIAGLLPLILDFIGLLIERETSNHIPFIITAFALPLAYYISMELFQVLRPTALRVLQSDDLKASAALQSRVSKVIQNEFASNLSHQWAVFIHGKILTRLAATSLKLESASKTDDSKTFYEATESLLLLLESPDQDFESDSTDLQVEVSSRLNPWKGLLEINLYIDPVLKSMRNSRVRDLGEVIEELISNSIRHGKAQKIELKVVRSGQNDVEIISIDDSIIPPPEQQGRSGLGTRIFNLASDGRWSISRVGATTEFRLIMGINP